MTTTKTRQRQRDTRTTRERAQDLIHNKLDECTNPQQVTDVFNKEYDREELIGKPILITSVRARRSQYGHGNYAIFGFISDELGPGRSHISGFAGRNLLELEEKDLPVKLVLRQMTSQKNGYPWYKWEIVK